MFPPELQPIAEELTKRYELGVIVTRWFCRSCPEVERSSRPER